MQLIAVQYTRIDVECSRRYWNKKLYREHGLTETFWSGPAGVNADHKELPEVTTMKGPVPADRLRTLAHFVEVGSLEHVKCEVGFFCSTVRFFTTALRGRCSYQ